MSYGLLDRWLTVARPLQTPPRPRFYKLLPANKADQRFCPVCETDTAEDEHHFVFDCPEYSSIRERFTAIFWGPAPTLSSFFTLHKHKVIAKFLHEHFTHRSMLLEGVLGVPQH